MLYNVEFNRSDHDLGDDADFDAIFEGPRCQAGKGTGQHAQFRRHELHSELRKAIVDYGRGNSAVSARVFMYVPFKVTTTGERTPSRYVHLLDIDLATVPA